MCIRDSCPIDHGTYQRVFRDMVHVCDIVMAQYFLQDHLEIPLSLSLIHI